MSVADHDLQALEAALELLDRHARLRRTLHGVQQCLEQIDNFVSVGSFALRAQVADIDCGVAAVLDAAVSAVQKAHESLVMAALDSAEKLDLRASLATVRDKLRQLNSGGQGGDQLSAGEDATQPDCTEPATRAPLKQAVNREIGRLHKTHALLIATQFAANHEAEFDVSDALAAILERVEQSLTGLDAAEAMEQPKEAQHGRR